MKPTTSFAACVLALTVFPVLVTASGPIAVYALVDKVVLEPNADKAERVRISGVFSTAKEQSDVYLAPQRGYLYFRLPRENEELARREWADLKSVAGTRQVVGLGSSWHATVHVTTPNDSPTSPAEYPMGNGLVRMNSDHPRARALLDYKEH